MSRWKSFNDCYCKRCGVNTRCYQPSDFRTSGKGSKAKAWYCRKCLKSKFGITELVDKDGDDLTWTETA